ncbi:MAG TPA: isoprenylcysteine carboxylmethyltransferase family protein [Blastocatellia bacterium]|nr:isoprenylcysteine carboxylmethyltransferase family protein [Blastocatellia bacterium]
MNDQIILELSLSDLIERPRLWRGVLTFIKTTIFTIFVPGTVTILVPRWLLASSAGSERFNIGVFRYVGVVPILLGALIYLWCAWDFTFAGKGTPAPIDPPKELVARGLYRYVRNPMYVGIASVLIGETLLFQSLVLFAYLAAVLLAFGSFVVFYEEPALTRKFGESYLRYRKDVPRWIPRLKS